MSDVTVAPAASPPTNNAPAAPRDVPVTPSPNMPNPVGPQTPDRPPEQRTENRRESIQKAFERSRQENPPKPREAKIGDNNPPEETKVERRAQAREKLEPIDLKKRPVDQPKEPVAARAEHGHFAPRNPQAAQQARPGGQQQHKQLPPTVPYHQPLPRMSDRAKADWHAVPESVRADAHRLHAEFGKAYQKFRSDHDYMNSIRPFAQMAHQQGTNLHHALTNYVGMEHKLRNDVVGGLDLIVNNLNLRADDGTREGRKLTLMDVAWHIVNQTPEQRQLLQSRNNMMAQSHQLQAAQQRIAALEKYAKQTQYVQAFGQTRAGVDQYAATHPRLDELGDLIEQEVKLGFDLDTAYRRAELLRPATAAQTRNDATAAQTRSTTAQTRTADRSISGAPSGSASSANGHARPGKQVGRREAIANAIKRAGSQL